MSWKERTILVLFGNATSMVMNNKLCMEDYTLFGMKRRKASATGFAACNWDGSMAFQNQGGTATIEICFSFVLPDHLLLVDQVSSLVDQSCLTRHLIFEAS